MLVSLKTMNLIAAFTLVLAFPALAQTKLTVLAGQTVVLDSNAGSITLDKSVDAGLVSLVRDETTKISWIVFKAPNDKGNLKTLVAYSVGGIQKTIDVQTVLVGDSIGPTASALTKLLVLALLLEQAFALVFNWRVFLEFFDSRGVRSPLMLAGAYGVVKAFDLDIFGQLLAVYSTTNLAPGWDGMTSVFTAMILAGGSKAVNALMVNLGLRDNRPIEALQAKPAKDMAWFSVTIDKAQLQYFRGVYFCEGTVAKPPTEPSLAGGGSTFSAVDRLSKYFWRSANRFPATGGYAVSKDAACYAVVRFQQNGEDLTVDLAGRAIGKNEQPAAVYFAPGAIIDFKVRLPADRADA